MTTPVERAAELIKSGGVVCHATEGVWGFACNPWNETAVSRILTIKHRSWEKGLLVIGANASHFAAEFAGCSVDQEREVVASWPGAHTWILPNTRFEKWVTGSRNTVGCRVPGHVQARELCALAGVLISTSANISNGADTLQYEQADERFAAQVDYVLPGAVIEAGKASTIRALDGTVLR